MRFVSAIRHVVLLALLIAALGYLWYVRTPCHIPITYTIGAVDGRFHIDRTTLQDALKRAAYIWNTAAGKVVLTYSETGGMPVNLVYDDRQATTQKNHQLENQIMQTTDTAESIKQSYESAQAQYRAAKTAYESKQAAYTNAVKDYNASIDYWNARDGAPKSEYATLQSQKAALQSQAAALENDRISLNAQAAQLNTLAKRYNDLSRAVNANVSQVNKAAGQEFDEALYSKNVFSAKIDVFQYDNETKLIRVLAHEFGHSLGMPHNDNPASIMYALNQSTDLKPTLDDIQSLNTTCRL